MSYIFTASEIIALQAARRQCPVDDVNPTSAGNWVPFYTTMSAILAFRISEGAVSGPDLEDLQNAKLWLDVAIGANGGTGMHSAFIRAYTNRQGELRTGNEFSAAQMQLASNGVALNLWLSLSDPVSNAVPWALPSISEIANADASSIGRNLFQALLPSDDTAITANAGWSGAIGFNLLGGAPPYESWRLLTSADGHDSTATLNTLDDLKNVLFATNAYDDALAAGALAGGADFAQYCIQSFLGQQVQNYSGPITAQVNIGMSSGVWSPFIDSIVARTPEISSTVRLIGDVGYNRFLDMTMGSYLGSNLLGTTNDDNFDASARSFFGQFTPAVLAANPIEILSAGSLAEHAMRDVDARAALVALSVVKVHVAPEIAAKLSMYDDATGLGLYSQQWISDRGEMLGTLLGAIRQGNESTYRVSALPTGTYFDDLASGVQLFRVPHDGLAAKQFVVFGGERSDVVQGAVLADRLYGGEGGDSLEGFAGVDRLEAGYGNDVLDGGADNDLLIGGAGLDEYRFSGEFGVDRVIDAAGGGVITLDGSPITGGKRVLAGVDIWQDAGKLLDFVKVARGDGQYDLLVRKHAGVGSAAITGSILLKNWSDGAFGITLQNNTPAKPTTVTFRGDQRAKIVGSEVDLNVGPNDAGYHDYKWSATSWANNGNLTGGVSAVNFSDVIYGAGTADLVQGLGGNDALDGGDGDDKIEGGAGTDLLAGGAGSDLILGGDSNDMIVSGHRLQVNRQANADAPLWAPPPGQTTWISGDTWGVTGYIYYLTNDGADNQSDSIDGGAGDDNLNGSHANDVIVGGLGNDSVSALGGSDMIIGGDGDDNLSGDGTPLPDFVQTTVQTLHGSDFLDGGAGNDRLFGHGGADLLLGGLGDDLLMGDHQEVEGAYHGRDYLDGGLGNDLLEGGGGADHLTGDDGNDRLHGDSIGLAREFHGDDVLDGGRGDDFLAGMGGNDTLNGEADNDYLMGDVEVGAMDALGHGSDQLNGGGGSDTLLGGGGTDYLVGGDGDDWLAGEDQTQTSATSTLSGDDALEGGAGNDVLIGGNGNDVLMGGSGENALFGGEGDDRYVIDCLSVAQDGDDDTTPVPYSEAGVWSTKTNDLNVPIAVGSQIPGFDDEALDVSPGAWMSAPIVGAAGFTPPTTSQIFDKQGKTTISFDGVVACADTNTDGNLRLVLGDPANSHYLTVDSAFVIFGQVMEMGGEQISVRDWVQSNMSQRIIISADGSPDNYAFGAAGGDTIYASSTKGTMLDGGWGNDGLYGHDFADAILGDLGSDYLSGGGGDDTLDGGDGDDYLMGGGGNNLSLGGLGNDTIQASGSTDDTVSADVIEGGSGDDLLKVDGSDSVRFGLGDGHDIIATGGMYGGNAIIMDDGILAQDVTIERVFVENESGAPSNLLISLPGGEDSILIEYYAAGNVPAGPITSIEFADGSRLDAVAIAERSKVGNSLSNTLYGYAGDDELTGLGGDDTLVAYQGHDSLYGGAGSDHLSGRENIGSDSLWGEGGNDWINGGGGDKVWGGDGDDYLAVSTDARQVDGGTGNDSIVLDAGPASNLILRGGDGDDLIQGPGLLTTGAGKFSYEGGKGNDLFSGVVNADIKFGLGDGKDQIWLSDTPEDSRTSTVYLSTGITTADVVGSSRVDLQACKLEYSIVSPK